MTPACTNCNDTGWLRIETIPERCTECRGEKQMTNDAQARPAEWRWVPVEPTEEMVQAAHDAYDFKTCTTRELSGDVYRLMLAAAPPSAPQPASAPSVSEDLRKLSEAATPGQMTFTVEPQRYPECDDADLPGFLRVDRQEVAYVPEKYGPNIDPVYEANGNFLAACWNHVRTLLAQGGQNVG